MNEPVKGIKAEEATPLAEMVQLMADAHQAARTGRHLQCRDALSRLEAWSTDSEVDSGIAALYLMIGDKAGAQRLVARSTARGRHGSLVLGVESFLYCTEGRHEASRAAALRWMHAADLSDRTVEDWLAEDAEDFNLPPAHSRDWHRSQKLLAQGRLSESLALLSAAYDVVPPSMIGARRLRTRNGTVPRWGGERTAHLVVVCGDGHGDAFFAWRYVRALQLRADRVSMVTTKAAGALLDGMVPGVDVFPLEASEAALRYATAYTDWWPLPGLLDTLAPEPYIPVPAPMVLPDYSGAAIGIVYGGSRANRDNHLRSVPAADLVDLFTRPGITWHSLMVDPGYVSELPACVVDLAPRLRSFRDTAAAIAALDGVVTIDSSVANLAGAMGKPVMLLAELDGDFRWFGTDGRSAWYPSAQVFRQQQAAEWSPAITALSAVLSSARP